MNTNNLVKKYQKLLENSNFLNAQNYMISKNHKKGLLTKIEYRSSYKKKSGKKEIEYPYLTNFDGDRFKRRLNVGESAQINNVGVVKSVFKIADCMLYIFTIILFLVKVLSAFVTNNKYMRILFGMICLFLVYLLYDDIVVYTGNIMNLNKISFGEAFIHYLISIKEGLIYNIKQFLLGTVGWSFLLLILYAFVKIKGLFFKWNIVGKYLFLIHDINKDSILVYRYK